MRFAHQIATIKDRQEKLVDVERGIKSGCKKLEKDVKKIVTTKLQEAFPSAEFADGDWSVGVDSGCMSNKWTPEVYFYSINGYCLSSKGFWFEETFEKFSKVEPPINTREFLIFLKDLTNELGLKCRFLRHEPSDRVPTNCKDGQLSED